MGWYPRNSDEMTQMLNRMVDRHLVGRPETTMLILPLLGVRNTAEVNTVLLALTSFNANGSGTPVNEAGTFVASNEVTAMDALRQFENGAANFGRAALESLCYVEIKGQSVLINFPGAGKVWIDVKKFARLTGAAEIATGETFSAYLYKTAQPEERFVLVAIKGLSREAQVSTNEAVNNAIASYLDAAAEKARHAFDTNSYAGIPSLEDGWQLRAHPQFQAIVDSVRGGYAVSVQTTANGLEINY